jgi:DnaJ-class molecular chaperone
MLTEEYSEFICDRCYGTGRVRMTDPRRYKFTVRCPKCKGVGKLDWIEHITGERYEAKS